MTKKDCILVLGMHRSGTSSLAGTLSKMSIAFGQNISAASFDNPKGYFENTAIQDLNNRLLSEFNIEWDFPGFLPLNWYNLPKIKAYDQEAKTILEEEFGTENKIAIKDPRICYLLPFWKRVLKHSGYNIKCLFSYRNPDEIAQSLSKRNNFSLNKGQVLTTTHLLAAESNSRNLVRAAVNFSALIQNPAKEIKRINKIFKLGYSDKEISNFNLGNAIDKKLKHHTRSKNYSNKVFPSYMQDHEKLWSKVIKATTSFKELKAFDKIRKEHEYLTEIFYDGIIGQNDYSFKIFVDTGKGFNEKQTIKQTIVDSINTWQNEEVSKYENISAIKIAPANTLCAINLKYLGVVGARKSDYNITSNAYYSTETEYYFDTPYPEILLDFKKPKQLSKMPVTIEYLAVGKEVLNLIQNVDYQRIIVSKDSDITNFENILKDRDHYLNLKDKEISELTDTITEYEKIKDSYEERYKETVNSHTEELNTLKEALDAERNRFALEHKEKIETTNLLKDNIDALKDQKNSEVFQLKELLENEQKDKLLSLEKLREHYNNLLKEKENELTEQKLQLAASIDDEKNDKIGQLETLRSQFSQMLQQKDEEIKQLQKEIYLSIENERNDKTQKLEQVKTLQEERLAKKDNEIKAITEQLRISLDSEKGDKLVQLEGLRAHFSKLLLQKDQEIKQLSEELRISVSNEKEDKNTQLNKLRDVLTKEKQNLENELNAVIANYREQVIDKDKELNEIRFKLMDDLNREKTEKVEQIAAYKDSFFTQLTDKESELRLDLKKAMEEKNRVLVEHKDEMFSKENEYRETLNTLRKEYKDQYEALRIAKENTIQELRADILKLKEQVSAENYEKLKSVTKLETLIEKERLEKKNEFTLLQAQNEREVDELINSNNRLMLDIADLKQTLLAKINEGEYAEQVVDTMNQELDTIKQLYQLKEQEVHEIRRSLSFKLGWTITAPARIVYNVATGAKKTKERSKLFLELAGNGIKNPKKMLQSLNRENIKTLKKALSTESPELIARNYKHHLQGTPANADSVDETIIVEEAKHIPQKKNDNKKNILFISPNLPDYDESAGGKRAWYMLKLLQEEYQVYAYTKGQKLAHHRKKLEDDGIIIIDTHNFQAIKRSIPKFETIIFGWYYTMNESGKILQYYPEALVVVDTVDIHWVREERSIGNWDGIDRKKWQANKLKEVDVYNRADRVWVVSEADAEAVQKEIPEADLAIVSIIEDIKKTQYLDPSNNNILFLGGYRHYPNITAAKILAEQIFPIVKSAIPNATLTIAGSNAPQEVKDLEKLEGVSFKGFIKDEDIPRLYNDSFIAVVPLVAGAGVKGKICEAISYSLPVVTNAIGNEGINLEHGKEAFITEDTTEMAHHVISAMKREVDLASMTKGAQHKFLDLVGPEVNKKRMLHSLVKEVSICIVTYNKLELLQKCISSIHGNTHYPNYKIIVHSNGCEDGTKEFLTAAADADSRIVPILSKTNDVFVLPNNGMMKMFPKNDVVLLNNDVEVTENWLTALVDTAYSDKHIGVVGSKILFPDGKLQEFGGILYTDGSGKNIGKWEDPDQDIYKSQKRASFVSGCSFYIKRTTINKIGVFDEQFHPCYCEDADYCYTAWENGLEVVVEPNSIIFHFEGATSGTDTSSGFKKYQTINMEKFHNKHGKKVDEVNEKVARLNDELVTVRT